MQLQLSVVPRVLALSLEDVGLHVPIHQEDRAPRNRLKRFLDCLKQSQETVHRCFRVDHRAHLVVDVFDALELECLVAAKVKVA